MPDSPVILPKREALKVMVTRASERLSLTRTEPAEKPPPQQPAKMNPPTSLPVSGSWTLNFGDLASGAQP